FNPRTNQWEDDPNVPTFAPTGEVDLSTGQVPQISVLPKLAQFGKAVLPTAATALFGPVAGLATTGAIAAREEGKAGIERDKAREAEANAAIGLPANGATPAPDANPLGVPPAPAAPAVPATVSTTQRTLKAKGEDEALAGLKGETEKAAQAEEAKGQILKNVAGVQAGGLAKKAA